MKVYQLIYTAVRYSLSDPMLNLDNSPGYKVYSCSQGLTKEEIEEIVCFCGYKKPEHCNVEYSKNYNDKTVPELFPKTFRTLKLTSGKYAAIQCVFSGVDFNGDDGNFFAHALIFDDVSEGFMPENYYGNSVFRTYLTDEEEQVSLVRYLPCINDIEETENLGQWLDLFSKENRQQISYLVEKAVQILHGESKTHLCLCAETQEESDYYLLVLKRLLPYELVKNTGISTNNTFLPTSKQDKILFNATIKGHNNITEEMIEQRENCIYIDFCDRQTGTAVYERLFEMSNDELQSTYKRYGIDQISEFENWLISYNRINENGIGERLLRLKTSNDFQLFKNRCMEIYQMLDNPDMQGVKFEVLKVMHNNIGVFEDISEELTLKFVETGITNILNSMPTNMEGIFKSIPQPKERALLIKSKIDDYMTMIAEKTVDEQQAMLILRFLSIIKQASEFETWKEFLGEKNLYIFVPIAADVLINDTVPVSIIAPIIWTNSELAETVAYIDSSTDDEEIRAACRKFILNNPKEDWAKYGIEIIHSEKSREERENDILKIRKMLGTVGYVPFQRSSYQDLKYDVLSDINSNDNPLLLTRFLNSYYEWQMTEQAAEAKQCAEEIKSLILEIRDREYSCYQFIFPKLALEMLSTPGMYHEIMINFETMQETFWNWFLIGAERSISNDIIYLNYERVFTSNEQHMKKLAIYFRLKKIFIK